MCMAIPKRAAVYTMQRLLANIGAPGLPQQRHRRTGERRQRGFRLVGFGERYQRGLLAVRYECCPAQQREQPRERLSAAVPPSIYQRALFPFNGSNNNGKKYDRSTTGTTRHLA